MRQEEWAIDTDDGYRIYGVTDFAGKSPADKCLVLVHGLSGSVNEYHIKTAANYFVACGYDIFRFNLYFKAESGRSKNSVDGRRLRDCTLQIHAQDLNQVLKHKTREYSKLYLAGHSYGGPTIMVAQPQNASAISLWDPTFNIPNVFSEDKIVFERENGLNIWNLGVEKIIGDAFIEEAMNRYDEAECLSLSKSLSNVPIQVLTAEDCIYINDKKSWNSAGHSLNERHIIKGADHCFFRGNTLDDVLKLSHAWFEKF